MNTVEGLLGMAALGQPAAGKGFLHSLELQQRGKINQGSYDECKEAVKDTRALNHSGGLCCGSMSSKGTEESPTDALKIPLFPRELDLWHAKRPLLNRLSNLSPSMVMLHSSYMYGTCKQVTVCINLPCSVPGSMDSLS